MPLLCPYDGCRNGTADAPRPLHAAFARYLWRSFGPVGLGRALPHFVRGDDPNTFAQGTALEPTGWHPQAHMPQLNYCTLHVAWTVAGRRAMRCVARAQFLMVFKARGHNNLLRFPAAYAHAL